MLGDIGRFLWWSALRTGIRERSPAELRALSHLIASVEPKFRAERRVMMAEELDSIFGSQLISDDQRRIISKQADRLWTRCLLEELTLDAHSPQTIGRWMRFRGRGHLDAALASGKGAILVFPHAGNVMMLIALLAHSGYDYAQVAARGFPEDGGLQEGAHRPSRLNRLALKARERAEDSLNAEFIPFFRPRQMVRALQRGAILGLAFDGRASQQFIETSYLGQRAYLAKGPWKLAHRYQAPLVPAVCAASTTGPHELICFPPVLAREDETLTDLQQRTTQANIEPFLLKHPEHYLRWLTHCRRHAGGDQYPLFPDTSPNNV